MSANTSIEWSDDTFNGWEGCQHTGPGCDNCYAEARNARYGKGVAHNWGAGAPRRRTSVSNWKKPLAWNAKPFYECTGCGWRGRDHLSCPECSSLALVSARPRVFCSSLADVFDNAVDPQWRADLIKLIEETPNLDWLLLTKRIGNVNAMIPEATDLIDYGEDWQSLWGQGEWPANVWLGATIVNQEEADRDIPKLLAIPANKRFLSIEPMLGSIDFYKSSDAWHSRGYTPWMNRPILGGIDWVIVGGESGPGARPMHPDWVREVRDQCVIAGVPFLFKQWGEWSPGQQSPHLSNAFAATKLFQFLEYKGCRVGTFKAGKKAAGRLLDGVEWNQFPEGA